MTEKALTVPNTAVTPTLADTMSLADAFARSGFFQDANDVAKAIVKIQAGRELGIPPVASMTGVYIVKGRVTLSANILAALVKKHPLYDYHILTHDDQVCSIEFHQGDRSLGVSDFTIEDAQKAGLANGTNWRNYPRNMLFARAMSNGVKWYCPDVMGGAPVYTPDEMGETVTQDGSIQLFATEAQKEAIKEQLRVLFPEMTFEHDGHYTYILRHNGHPGLNDLTSEQADLLLENLYHEGPITSSDTTDDVPLKLEGVGRSVDELVRQGEAKMAEQPTVEDEAIPNLTPPTEWTELWQRVVPDLKFNHKNHARHAYESIFPHATAQNPPAIANAWAMLIQHQQEKGRLEAAEPTENIDYVEPDDIPF